MDITGTGSIPVFFTICFRNLAAKVPALQAGDRGFESHRKYFMKRIHGNVKCDCGHTQKDHYQNGGWCHHTQHKKVGKCGCTWFYPNTKYIKMNWSGYIE